MTLVVRPLAPADEPAVLRLREEAFKGNLFFHEWHWRYRQVPTASHLWVAEVDGEIVGFVGYIHRPMQLASGITVPAVSGGDAVIDAAERGRGFGVAMMTDARAKVLSFEDAPILAFVWAGEQLASQLYVPRFHYRPTDKASITYGRLLSWAHLPVDDRPLDVGDDDLSILVEAAGLPTLHIRVRRGEVAYSAAPGPPSDVRLRVGPGVFAVGAVARGWRRTLAACRALASGSFMATIRPSSMAKVVRNRAGLVAAMRSVFSPGAF